MSGRRAHPRFRTLSAWIGSVRVVRDISVEWNDTGGQLTVVSDTPGTVDEELNLGLASKDGEAEIRVRVLESRPLIVDGIVRHRLKLLMLDAR